MTEASASRAETIAESLRGQILTGKYAPGERLPSERELSARLGANRASVREALKKLEQLGMIAIRPGGGARVVPLEQAGLGALRHVVGAKAPTRELVAQWLDVQELVIAGAARLAVERGTKEELAAAKVLLQRLRAAETTDEAFVSAADELTELIAVASRNMVLRMVRNGLTATAQQQSHVRAKLRPPRKQLLPMLRSIEQAMDARDAAATEAGVRKFLRGNRALALDLIAGPAPGN
jgi:GntR family transcriptional regulator, transcriptional repressor for pyruvate dehydrogenase complex